MIEFWINMVNAGYSINKVPMKYRDDVNRYFKETK